MMLKRWWLFVGVLSVFVAVASAACGNRDWSCEPRPDARVQGYNLCTEQPPKYEVPTVFSQFTAEPQSGVYLESNYHTNTIVLHCNVSGVSVDGFVWEHDGDVVETSSLYTITGAEPLSSASILTISGFSESTHWQGDYRCIVQNGNFTLASRTAHLEAPKFHNWVDEAYPAQPGQDHVTLHVHNGDAVLLECQANTTNQVSKVVWSRDGSDLGDIDSIDLNDHYGLPSGSLLVRDVALTVGKDLVYECQVILAQPSGEMLRTFTLTLQSEDVQEEGLVSVRPVGHKEALKGTYVELYCLPGHGDSQPQVTWYKEGVSLDKLKHPPKTIGKGEVLWIENFSVDAAGTYTCSVSSGNVTENSTANLVIVEPYTIATISLMAIDGDEGYQYDSTIYIPVDRGNVTFHVICNTDAIYSVVNEEYVWFFRGKPMTQFIQVGNTLVVQSLSPWDLIGSLQCIVNSLAGSVSTSARILIKDKPNPPTNLQLRRDEEYPFQYELSWDAPVSITNQTLTKYTVEVFVIDYNTVCSQSLNPEYPFTSFLANDYHEAETHLYFVLSSSTTTGQSDFICERQTVPIVPPPQVDLFSTATRSGHQWNVALKWVTHGKFNSCNYPAHFDTYLNLECDGVKLLSNECISASNAVGSHELSTNISCSSSCDWTVKMTPRDDYNGTYTTTSQSQPLKTGSLVPSQPPTLESVDWSNSDGKSVTAVFTVPKPSSSCHPHYLVLRYSDNRGVVGAENITFGEYDRTKTEYNQTTYLRNAQCWQQYYVSIAYGNIMGQSEFSNTHRLRGPSEDDVRGFTSVTSKTVNSTAITVHVGLGEGVNCLMSIGYISGSVCYAENTGECREWSTSIGCLSLTEDDITFGRLRPFTWYCFRAEMHTRDNGSSTSMNSIITSKRTNEASPTGKPLNLEISRSSSDEIEHIIIIWNPPLNTTVNGILIQYSITVAISNGTTIHHKSMPCTTCVWRTPPIAAYWKCQVKVSACTSVGCGPAANQTLDPDGSATPPTQETDSTGSSSNSNVSTVVVVIVVAVVAVVAITALIVLAVIFRCRCRLCKKHTGESRQGGGSWESLEESPLQEAVPTTTEFPVLRDEPIRQDDLISVGKPAPSIATEHTECHPLMAQYLKDCEDYPAPDGEVDHTLPPEVQRETLNTVPDSLLLGTTPNQGKIMELNNPTETRKREGAEKVELQTLPLQYILTDELKGEERIPLLGSKVTGKGFTAKEQVSSKSHQWRGLLTLGKKSPNNFSGQQFSTRSEPLGKPPSPQQPTIPSVFACKDGYVSEEAVRRPSCHTPLETELEQLLVKPGPEYVPKSPEARFENQALRTCTYATKPMPTADKPVDSQSTGLHSDSHTPPFRPVNRVGTLPPTIGLSPSYTQQTHMDASGYIQQGLPGTSGQPEGNFAGDIWDTPTSPAMNQLWPSPQRDHMGYVQDDQNTTSMLGGEGWSLLKGTSELELLSQHESDASSVDSSVFEDTNPVGDIYHVFPPTASRVPQRNRSAMTSGVFSQSEQIASSSSSEPKDSSIGFCETSDNSATNTFASGICRMESEGYVSQPSTPGIKHVDSFGFQQAVNTAQPSISAAPTYSAAVDSTNHSSERDQVGIKLASVGHHLTGPASLLSSKNPPKPVGQGKELPRSSFSSGPSMVTWLYQGKTVATSSDGSGDLKELSVAGCSSTSGGSVPPSPVTEGPFSRHSNAFSHGMTPVSTDSSYIGSFPTPVSSVHAYLSSADFESPHILKSLQKSSPHATAPHDLGASSTRTVKDCSSLRLADGYVSISEDPSFLPGGHGTSAIRNPQISTRPTPPTSPGYKLPTLLLVPSSQGASCTSPSPDASPISLARATTTVERGEQNLSSLNTADSLRPLTGYV